MTKIGICSDHAGVEYKAKLIKRLERIGYEVVNFGTDTTESMDYPDVAHPLAEAVAAGRVDIGIAMCGTGNGMQLCLNHHSGIRAGLAWNGEVASLLRRHNNANVLVMPARFASYRNVVKMTDIFLSTPFEGGRHERRVEKIEKI